MAARVPEKLKTADIARFAQRAFQVEPHKPAVAYWAYYYIVKQILEKDLHSADDACKEYTTTLMDKLEQMKTQHPTEDAITDDMAGQAYVEQFGMEIFQRADNAVIANKTTRTTGDNFWTAATFLDLLHIWGDPPPDIARKIKYAKVQAARIFKAIKAGEDPNLSNPTAQPAPEEAAAPLDPEDPDVQRINEAAAAQPPPAEAAQEPQQPLVSPPPPSVVEVPDEHDRLQQNLARQSSLNESLHPSRAPSIPRPAPPEQPPAEPAPSISPVPQPSDESQPFMGSTEPSPRKDSAGGGYFPETRPQPPPVPPTELLPRDVNAAQAMPPGQGWTPPQGQPISPGNTQSFYRDPPVQSPPVPPTAPMPQHQTPHQPPQQHPGWAATPPPAAQHPPQAAYQYQQPPPPPASSQPQQYLTDDAAMTAAQKHAKFAISALNFEDVPTAVKQLREALRSLGAS